MSLSALNQPLLDIICIHIQCLNRLSRLSHTQTIFVGNLHRCNGFFTVNCVFYPLTLTRPPKSTHHRKLFAFLHFLRFYHPFGDIWSAFWFLYI